MRTIRKTETHIILQVSGVKRKLILYKSWIFQHPTALEGIALTLAMTQSFQSQPESPDPVQYFPAAQRLHAAADEAPAQPGQSALSMVSLPGLVYSIMDQYVCSDFNPGLNCKLRGMNQLEKGSGMFSVSSVGVKISIHLIQSPIFQLHRHCM